MVTDTILAFTMVNIHLCQTKSMSEKANKINLTENKWL